MRNTAAFVAGIIVGVVGWIVLGHTGAGRDFRSRVQQTVDGFVDGIVEGLSTPRD